MARYNYINSNLLGLNRLGGEVKKRKGFITMQDIIMYVAGFMGFLGFMMAGFWPMVFYCGVATLLFTVAVALHTLGLLEKVQWEKLSWSTYALFCLFWVGFIIGVIIPAPDSG